MDHIWSRPLRLALGCERRMRPLCAEAWRRDILSYLSTRLFTMVLPNLARTFQGVSGKESACQCGRHRSHGFSHWVGKIPWRRKWQPIPVFLPGESYGQRSLVGNWVRCNWARTRTKPFKGREGDWTTKRNFYSQVSFIALYLSHVSWKASLHLWPLIEQMVRLEQDQQLVPRTDLIELMLNSCQINGWSPCSLERKLTKAQDLLDSWSL